MSVTIAQKNLVLSVLFFLPVAFVVIMMLSKENYETLDVVHANITELPKNDDNIQLEDHLTVLAFFGKHPLKQSTAALNLKELIYDRCKGFKKFQIVVLLPEVAKSEANTLLKQIKSYEDLRFWHFVYAPENEIKTVFNSLKSKTNLDENLATNAVFIVDKDKHQRGRLDDRTEKEKETKKAIYGLYEYNCVEVSELKNKMSAEDLRILFTEYRQKRKGKFNDSNERRTEDLKSK